MEKFSSWFIVLGALILIFGVSLKYAPWLFSWFGNLPGDINYKSGKSRVFIPITSMLIISIVGSILFNLFKK